MKKIIITIIFLSFCLILDAQFFFFFGNKGRLNTETKKIIKKANVYSPALNKRAISQAIDSLKHYSIWDTRDQIYFTAAYDSAYAVINWKDTSKLLTKSQKLWFQKNSGFHSEGTGFLNTNYNPQSGTNYTLNNSSVSGYALDTQYGQVDLFGAYDATNRTFLRQYNAAGGYTYFGLNGLTERIFAQPYTRGLYTINRPVNNNIYLWLNGVLVNTAGQTSNGIQNRPFYLLAQNSSGTAINILQNRIAFFQAGSALTNTQQVKLNEIVNRYLTAIGAKNTHKIYDDTDVQYKYIADRNNSDNLISVYCQEGSSKFGHTVDTICLSHDNGLTWIRKRYTGDDSIVHATIYPNGNVWWATRNNKMFLSKDSLTTWIEKKLYNYSDRTLYTLHTPSNAAYPGQYFRVWNYSNPITVNGTTLFAFGNYGNVDFGANPVIMCFSPDQGDSTFVFYKFGQNPYYRDNGTASPGVTGTLLGDATNTNIACHIHEITWNLTDPDTVGGNIVGYAYAGDANVDTSECGWWRLKYNIAAKTWNTQKIAFYSRSPRYQATGLQVEGDTIWWAGEYIRVDPDTSKYRGIWKCRLRDIPDTSKHIRLFNNNKVWYSLTKRDNIMIASYYVNDNAYKKILYSKNAGQTWVEKTLTGIYQAAYKPQNQNRNQDSEGWFLLHGQKYAWENKTVFVKFE